MNVRRHSPEVMLVTPPYHSGVVESAGSWLPLGLLYVGGALQKAGYGVALYDAMTRFHTLDQVRETLRRERPGAVFVSCITATFPDGIEVCRVAKEEAPETLTVLGNTHPSFMYEEVLRRHAEVNVIVRGEGEVTAVELMDAWKSGTDLNRVHGIAFRQGDEVVATPRRPFISDLDVLEPAWGLVQWNEYSYRPKTDSTLAVVSSSRGCTQRCSFCSQQLFWERQWRGRSAENFVAELELLKDIYGVDVVMLADETPTLDRKRWERILDLLIERDVGTEILMETRVDDILRDEDIMWKYRKANVGHIYVGVEATTQRTLDLFKKEIKVEQSKKALDLINEYNIVSETSFVLGMPDDTKEKIRSTVELATFYNPDLAFFLAIAPWPYSEIYPLLKPYVEVFDYRKYNLVEPVVKPNEMTINGVRKELGLASKNFYMNKLKSLDRMTPEKEEFMRKVVRIIATNSYLAEHMQGEMPEEMKKLLEKNKIRYDPPVLRDAGLQAL